MQSSIFLCLSQARRVERVAAGRASGVKVGGIDGGGLMIGPDGVAPTQIVGVSASRYPP